MDDLLITQLYNQFQNGKVIAWADLLKIMASVYGRSRDEVFEGMNRLIDEGKIVLPKVDTYCLPGTLEKLKKAEQEVAEWKRLYPDGKEMTRADFDKMNPAEKMQFATSGGRING